MNIKTGDKVRVMSGKDKGKEGKVTQVLPKLGMVVVEGINATVRHMKARGKQPGQRVNYNAPIRIEKVSRVSDKSQAKG
jgi:large subunit ribosomal protein L24